MSQWVVYLLACKDKTLYTGITTDLEARVCAHNSGKGAKYTRGRTPVRVVWFEEVESQSAALKRECEIKKLSRSGKQNLITD